MSYSNVSVVSILLFRVELHNNCDNQYYNFLLLLLVVCFLLISDQSFFKVFAQLLGNMFLPVS